MSNKDTIKIVFIGDIYYDIHDVVIDQKIKSITNDADFVVANLEAPLTDSIYSGNWKELQLRNSPHGVEVLSDLSVNIVTLANNHICDRGLFGLTDTLKILDANNIKYIGAGVNIGDAKKPYLINTIGLKLCFLNYTFNKIGSIPAGTKQYGTSIFHSTDDIEYIRNLNNKGYQVIVIMHWDMTRYDYPLPSTVELGKSIIEAGATLVIGHHPHVIQGYIYYENKAIVNSIGNFVFSNTSDGKTSFILSSDEQHGMMAEVELSNKLQSKITFHYTTYKIDSNIIVELDEYAKRSSKLEKLSKPLSYKYYTLYYRIYAIKRLLIRFLLIVRPSNINKIRLAHLLGLYKSIKNIIYGNR